jgi:hypothetical protein
VYFTVLGIIKLLSLRGFTLIWFQEINVCPWEELESEGVVISSIYIYNNVDSRISLFILSIKEIYVY